MKCGKGGDSAVYTYIEMNLFALSILLLIFINIHHSVYEYSFDQKLYLGLIGLNTVQLILDTLTYIAGLMHGEAAIAFNLWVNTIYYIVTPLPCALWGGYAYFQVYRRIEKLKQILPMLLAPICVSTVLAVLSRFNGFLFYVDAQNIYHRGKFFFAISLICVAYLVWIQLFIIRNRKRITRTYFIPIFVFAIPPFVGGIIQTAVYGVSLVWICMTASVMIVYINIQNDQLNRDHLTGLYNRRQMESYLQGWEKKSRHKKMLAGIMIDLDCFKSINDLWGHSTGDKALADAAEILKRSFRKKDMICRYGGDEFVVLFEIESKADLSRAVDRITSNTEKFEKGNKEPYSIRFSMGYDFLNRHPDISVSGFFEHIDALMYQNKKNQKILQ